jgi:hypothetical protein
MQEYNFLLKVNEIVKKFFSEYFSEVEESEIDKFIAEISEQIQIETFDKALSEIKEKDETLEKNKYENAKKLLVDFNVENFLNFANLCESLNINLDKILENTAKEILEDLFDVE